MKAVDYTKVEAEEVNVEGAKNATIRWLISQKDNAPNFALRMFDVQPGGFTPYHSHDWEHEVFVLEGSGMLITEKEEIPFGKYGVIYVDPNMKHQFRNTEDTVLRFLCIVPHQKTAKKNKKNKTMNPFAGGLVNNC